MSALTKLINYKSISFLIRFIIYIFMIIYLLFFLKKQYKYKYILKNSTIYPKYRPI